MNSEQGFPFLYAVRLQIEMIIFLEQFDGRDLGFQWLQCAFESVSFI